MTLVSISRVGELRNECHITGQIIRSATHQLNDDSHESSLDAFDLWVSYFYPQRSHQLQLWLQRLNGSSKRENLNNNYTKVGYKLSAEVGHKPVQETWANIFSSQTNLAEFNNSHRPVKKYCLSSIKHIFFFFMKCLWLVSTLQRLQKLCWYFQEAYLFG